MSKAKPKLAKLPPPAPAHSGHPLWPVHPAAKAPFRFPSYLMTVEGDAKTVKGTAAGFLTGIVYLAPGGIAGVGNLCPHASKGCAAACLFTAGRASFSESINAARVMRTRLLHSNRPAFLSILAGEIESLAARAAARGLLPAVRLNGTSDLPWETLAPDLFKRFPAVKFYDYTKNVRRCLAFAAGELPPNYHLTFSLSESNAGQAALALAAGVNVAAVADGVSPGDLFTLPGMTEPRSTYSADETDLRFTDGTGPDGRGLIGLLKAKGKAKRDRSGFVLRFDGKAAGNA